jgi:hypothetical protein
MKAENLSGKSIVGVLAVDFTGVCPASKIAWAAGMDCFLTVNYYGVSYV